MNAITKNAARLALYSAAALLANASAGAQENVLLLIADDIGVDRIAAYMEHPDPGNTPNIDALAAQGILFRNAWANPWCSPTRATILTGRYSFRTGVGTPLKVEHTDPGLQLSEVTIPEIIRPTYATMVLGKWHLAANSDGVLAPLDAGFDHHAGTIFNFPFGFDYFMWPKVIDGVETLVNTYATTDTVNDALQVINTLPEPWFVWTAFHAPHGPTHAPPDDLHSFDLSGIPNNTPVEHTKAMIEALDTELGRLLAGVDFEDTTVIFLGDNGTWRSATSPPSVFDHSKGTLYEGGVHVPLIIAGRGVRAPGTECDALVSSTDLFPTIVELAGFQASTPDSVSMLPYLSDPGRPSMRQYLFAEWFTPNGPAPYIRHERAVRDARYKLIRKKFFEPIEFYDLKRDPFELQNLLECPRLNGILPIDCLTPRQRAAYERLTAEMDAVIVS